MMSVKTEEMLCNDVMIFETEMKS